MKLLNQILNHGKFIYTEGTLTRLVRNMQGFQDTNQANFNNGKSIATDVKILLKHVVDIKKDFRQHKYHMEMQNVDLSEYFPLESDHQLQRFLDKTDGEWEERKKGFYQLLYNAVTTKKKRFACALLHILFKRDFIKAHKWPMSGG